MFAEAMMNTMPWDYWLDAEHPKPETAEVIAALETVMARNPEHPLATHLYIHAVEASSNPGRAEAAADRLADMVPGSGHLVHMPSHIYWRVGRYFDASEANVRAAKVDEDYIAQCRAQGLYPALYYPHNIHFLWSSASMEGRSEVAIEAGRKVAANVRLEQIREYPTIEFFQTIPLLSLVRFAHWQEILQQPAPPAALPYSNAIWHYARAVALARTGEHDAAQAEIDAMQPLMGNESIWFLDGNDYPASQVLAIANLLARGELAQAKGDYEAAIAQFTAAVEEQDKLPYTEPPFWYYPTRQSLGSAMLLAGDNAGAEAVYRADLSQYPRNGWSLYGLSLSLAAQGKAEEAAATRETFEKIWGRADVTLESSVL
jgi:tetratricopeptide (TPR) repeat protein